MTGSAGTIIALVGAAVGCSLPVHQETAREPLYPSAVFPSAAGATELNACGSSF